MKVHDLSMKEDPEYIFNKFQNLFMGKTGDRYSEKVLTLAYEPLNVGEIKNPDGSARVQGSCGDSMEVSLKIHNSIITEIRFLTDGCGATLACGSAVTELARGKTIYQAENISPQTIIHYLDGLPESHIHCAVLAVQALQQALSTRIDPNQKKNSTP